MVNPFKILAALEIEGGTALLEEITKSYAKDADVTQLLNEVYEKQKDKLTKPKKRRRRGKPQGYIWVTRQDSRVRSAHRILHGQYIPWSSPPIAGKNGQRYHAGRSDGCRCFPMRVKTKEQAIQSDWVNGVREALGYFKPAEEENDSVLAKKNRRTLLEQLRASIPQAPTPRAKGPIRKVKRVVWGGG